MSGTPATFRFGLGRMLLLIALVGLWIAGLRVLPPHWALWLTTLVFYLGVTLSFSTGDNRTAE